jgi:glutamyl-tRNA(Gln) amidotransferase subunit E
MERIGEITGEQVEHILKMFKKKKISKDGVYDLMKHIAERGVSIEKAIEKVVGKADLDKIVDKVIKQRAKLIKEQGEKAVKPLMGLVMKELRGKYSGEKIYKKLKKRIKEMLK